VPLDILHCAAPCRNVSESTDLLCLIGALQLAEQIQHVLSQAR
jgi:hypothetical protein